MTMESACLHEPLPLPEHTVRRETPDGGQAAVTLYPVFPGIDIRYHDVHAGSCPMDPAAPGVLEISHCREGRMEYRLGSRYFYLAPGDLSVARQDVLPTLAAFPTGHYHGITVTVDPGLAPRCLSCFLEDVEVQPAALAEKFCAAGGYFAARSSRRVEHVFSELYHVPEDLWQGYLKVKVLELVTPRLVPDGAFVLGAAETVLGLATKLTCDPQHRGLYRHAAMAAPVAASPASSLRPRPAIAASALRG